MTSQERADRWVKVNQATDKLKELLDALLETEQELISLGSGGVDEDNLEDGYFSWTHLPRLRRCLSETGPRQSPPSDEPCGRLALLWDTISQNALPRGVSLTGLCAEQTGGYLDNRIRFCISGEVSVSDLDKNYEVHPGNTPAPNRR